ncbi:MAG: hypothetical protein ABI211_06375, partial [Vicinamibacterales bacterium]
MIRACNATTRDVPLVQRPGGASTLLYQVVPEHFRDVPCARRWVNFPWAVVEAGGQGKAGEWTTADNVRLRALV